MIEVFIKSVSPFSEYKDKVYSYKVICLLDTGKEIELIDEKPFNLTPLIYQKVKIEIGSHFLRYDSDCKYIFEGVIKQEKEHFYFVNNEISITISKEICAISKAQIGVREVYCFEELFIKNILNIK